jgi:ophiobolin F synthase
LQATKRYKDEFLKSCEEFRQQNAPISEKLDRYLDALAYQVGRNIVWSLNCPRYYPKYQYDPNAGIEDELTAESLPRTLGLEYDAIGITPGDRKQDKSSRRSSTNTSQTSEDDNSTTQDNISISSCTSISSSSSETKQMPEDQLLGPEHVNAPFDYITSLPSKGVRDTFIDALNI